MNIDLRTYLLLERAFVRRLQRSWAKLSAPTYDAIARACNERNWNEARRLVPDLDMAEVGTENREWIQYMLLSCAVFGANTVAKGKPSFVGVGTFDTFLKQTTNNMLQYLEYGATAKVQEEARQLIAEDEAQATLKVAFDPGQPRDARGRWSVTGTAEFKAWFGASKVVDEAGKPKVVYKGMYPYDYTKEQPGQTRQGPLLDVIQRQTPLPDFPTVEGAPDVFIAGYFSDKPEVANEFIFRSGAVFPVYLSIQRPFEIDAKGDFAGRFQFGSGGRAFREAILSGKYDGVIIYNTKDEGTVYVPLKPEQIKSALSNRAFDPRDPRITKYDPSQPRDKEGQWTRTGVSRLAGGERRPGEDDAPDIEGAGPARVRWRELNTAVIDATDTFIDIKETHRQTIKRLEKQYDLDLFYRDENDPPVAGDAASIQAREQQFFKDPEYRASLTRLQDSQKAMEDAERALKQIEPQMKIEVVTNLAHSAAAEMGVHPWHINVVYEQPREFTVGATTFTEGAHYEPGNEQIVVNAQNAHYGDASSVKGILAHEMSHFLYHTMKSVADREFERYLAKAVSRDKQHHTAWYHERFGGQVGDTVVHSERKLDPRFKEEMEKEFPASAAMAHLAGGELFAGISKEMVKENGHSAYAKSYWTPEAVAQKGSYESAINETMAEITRYLKYPESWDEDTTPSPTSPWVKLTKAMHQWYKDRQARTRAAMAKNHPV